MSLGGCQLHLATVVLCAVSMHSAVCYASAQCPNYYDYYVPPMSRSTACNGTRTGCMSVLCEDAYPTRQPHCVESHTDPKHCWLTCLPYAHYQEDTAWLCRQSHARLPVVDSDEAGRDFQTTLKRAGVTRTWVDGGPVDTAPPSVSNNRSDWAYSDGTAIPERFWARGEPRGGKAACIQWNCHANNGEGGMEGRECKAPPPEDTKLICECNNRNTPLGALTRSQCIVEQPRGTMAQQCWRHAKQLVNKAADDPIVWHTRSLDTCQCAWCTENCDVKNQWTIAWWKKSTTTETTAPPTAVPTTVLTTVTQTEPMMPTVANDRIKFINKVTTVEHSYKKDEAMLTAMCIIGSVSVLLAALIATLITLNAVKHWQHKQRMEKAIQDAGKNMKQNKL